MKKLIAVVIVVLVVVLSLVLLKGEWNGGEGEQTACTLEALVCPDGSAVGRSGPTCTFSACPSPESYEGILSQSQSGFELAIAAPSEVLGSATYTLPLELRVSNAPQDFIGKRVRVYGTFEEGNTYVVETLEESEFTDSDRALVAVGESVLINGLTIVLEEVVQDNRCPVDVECIEAGGITARFTLTNDEERETRNVVSDEVPHEFGSHRVSIEEIRPVRLSAAEPLPGEYELVIFVENID